MRRRITDTTNVVALAKMFRLADDDTFTRNWFHEPLFGTVGEARRAWQAPGVRRAVWARQHRMSVPDPARVFDHLTRGGWEFVWSHWQHEEPFSINEALRAIAADRAAVDRFEQRDRRGAKSICDFLAKWREDLGALEVIARELGTWPGDSWQRPAPTCRMTTAVRYGGGDGVPDDAA
jgi:hypothetical protein